jgi:hypothetical protein
MAWVFVRYAPPNTPLYQVQMGSLEHRGLWSDISPTAPWDWRAQGRKSKAPRQF